MKYACEAVDESFFETAKVSLTASREIPCSSEKLFEIFEDPDSWSKWASAVKGVEWTSAKPFGVGTTRTVTIAGGVDFFEVFFEWDPGRRMAFYFEGTSAKIAHRFAEDYRISPLGQDSCRLEWTMAFDPRGPGRVMMVALKPLLRLTMPALLKKLAKLAANTP